MLLSILYFGSDEAFLDHQSSFAEMQNAEAQKEMTTVIPEVSSEFSSQSRDYSEESMKIESTTSQSHKVDEVKAGLKSERQFRNNMILKHEIDERLVRIRKMQEDLGEKLSAIKADISTIEANHSSIKANISAIQAIISPD